jgi:hypothetical protein
MAFELQKAREELGDLDDETFCKCEIRELLKAAIDRIEELEKALIDAGHRYADLQAVCDDQDTRIRELKSTLLREIDRSIGNYDESYGILRELVPSVEWP